VIALALPVGTDDPASIPAAPSAMLLRMMLLVKVIGPAVPVVEELETFAPPPEVPELSVMLLLWMVIEPEPDEPFDWADIPPPQ
jgi:hypothetical protein